MEQERAIRRDREAAGTPSSAYSSTQYTRSGVDAIGAGGGAPRSAMGKYYPGMMSGAAPSMRRPLVMDSDGYARRSEPSLSKGDIVRLEAKSEAMDVHGDLLRLRRSMPSASHNRMAEDLAWAHESIKQSEHRSTSASSSSSGTSTAPMGILARGLTVHSSDGNSGKPSAYQLQRARTADVVQRPDGQGQGDVSMLRQQVTLLRRSLEEEKKRRVMEQKLMQDKIIELQGLIRHNMPEQKRELERNLNAMRTPSGKQSVQALQRQQLQQQQQQLASQQQQAVASGVPSHMRAMRNCKQLQQAQERSPYKTMKLLSEVGPEQLDLDDGTDEEVGDVEEDCEDDADEDEDDDDDDEDIDEEEVPRIDNLDLSETKERRKSDGASSTHSTNDEDRQSAAVRAVETRMAQELTKLRARMRAVVLEAQNEVNTLKQRLDDDHKIHERKERQLRMESSLRVTSLEERHNYAKKKLLGKTSLLSTQVAMLTDENQKLLQEAKVKDERIRQLELALGGRRIVLDSTKPHQQKSNPQQQS